MPAPKTRPSDLPIPAPVPAEFFYKHGSAQPGQNVTVAILGPTGRAPRLPLIHFRNASRGVGEQTLTHHDQVQVLAFGVEADDRHLTPFPLHEAATMDVGVRQ